MIISRKHVISAIVTLLFMMANIPAIQAQRGEKVLGVHTGYISKNESAIAGLFFQYSFSEHFRLSPEIGCVFRHQGLDAFTLDANAHFPFAFSSSHAGLYPLAGINYSSWNYHNNDHGIKDIDDVSTRKSRFGLNAGAGFELRPTSGLKLKVEAKYCLIESFSSAQISVGIGYIF